MPPAPFGFRCSVSLSRVLPSAGPQESLPEYEAMDIKTELLEEDLPFDGEMSGVGNTDSYDDVCENTDIINGGYTLFDPKSNDTGATTVAGRGQTKRSSIKFNSIKHIVTGRAIQKNKRRKKVFKVGLTFVFL